MKVITNYMEHAVRAESMMQAIAERTIDTGKELVIDFSPEGDVEAMQSDRFSLGFLGAQQVRRATEITFNELNQNWDISLCLYNEDGKLAGYHTLIEAKGFSGYDAARQVEVKWLNLCRLGGIDPSSEEGKVLLISARAVFNEGWTLEGTYPG